jgi:hypothetical protein
MELIASRFSFGASGTDGYLAVMASLVIADLRAGRPRGAVAIYAWQHYLTLPEEELGRLDIAAVNLQCALGLPGSDQIDVPSCLQTINNWVPVVRRWTEAAYQQYFVRDPGSFRNSEAFFRIVALVTALQRHCGVRFDPTKVGLGPEAEFDFDEQFVHGVVQGAGGTCATLPIVFASVGRKLGYPIRLACAKRHLFCRWDDPRTGERWNMEGTSTEEGFDSFPDDHYRKWPAPIQDADEERAFGYLRSMTPRQELANFVAQRGFVLLDHGRDREAVEMFVRASELTPELVTYRHCILTILAAWKQRLQTRCPRSFPRLDLRLRPDRRRWPSIPWEVEREFIAIESLESVLTDPEQDRLLWQPLRDGRTPMIEVPESITVDCTRLTYI